MCAQRYTRAHTHTHPYVGFQWRASDCEPSSSASCCRSSTQINIQNFKKEIAIIEPNLLEQTVPCKGSNAQPGPARVRERLPARLRDARPPCSSVSGCRSCMQHMHDPDLFLQTVATVCRAIIEDHGLVLLGDKIRQNLGAESSTFTCLPFPFDVGSSSCRARCSSCTQYMLLEPEEIDKPCQVGANSNPRSTINRLHRHLHHINS